MNTFLSMLLGFLLAAAVVVTLYFTVLKKDVCAGGRQLYDCPTGDVSICTKPGMDYASYCKGGGSKGLRNLRTGPGNGQCVEGTGKPVRNMDGCNGCLNGSTTFWIDNTGQCLDAYSGDNASQGDTVAFNYGSAHPSFPCSSAAVVTDANPPGGFCP